MKLNQRDWDFIEARLLTPVDPLTDAIERLHARGFTAEAAQLMEAAQTCIDSVRQVRLTLQQQQFNRWAQ